MSVSNFHRGLPVHAVRIVLLAACLAFTSTVSSQGRGKTTLVLKGGSYVTGRIIADSAGKVLMKVTSPAIISVSKDDIAVIETGRRSVISKNPQKGYFIHLTSGVLAGQIEDSGVKSISVNLINGYRFENGISLGFGTGLENLECAVMPVYAEMRYNPLNARVSPYVWVKGGYGIPLVSREEDEDYLYGYYPVYDGGIMLNAGAALALYSWRSNAVTIGAGYRFQRLVKRYNYWYGPDSHREYVMNFNRIEVQFGFIFR
jgi:hypothetical protein